MKLVDTIGEDHVGTAKDTPIKADIMALSNAEKKAIISEHFAVIMDTLGLDLNDESLSGTPDRVAKMYVEEIFSGLQPVTKPKVTLFENTYEYKGMLVEKDIEVYSTCEHHFVPIIGKAHVAYVAGDHVIGLSKINRIVQYYSRRPQVQERLSVQIVAALKEAIGTEHVACIIDAKHLCVNSRGVRDTHSSTITASYSGNFKENETKMEFLKHVGLDSKLDI